MAATSPSSTTAPSAPTAARPLSARSTLLSLLLGAHPPELSAGALVAAGAYFGIAETTVRVALTRMTAAGDLQRTDAGYRLSTRLIERQRRQDAALVPPTTAWDGEWETVLITSAGRSAAERAELRAQLAELRLAEVREGVWMRPANLDRPLPAWPTALITTLRARPADPAALARRLWDPAARQREGAALLAAFEAAAEPAERLALGAAVVRHLREDPALPAALLASALPASALLPAEAPESALRQAYAGYQRELSALSALRA